MIPSDPFQSSDLEMFVGMILLIVGFTLVITFVFYIFQAIGLYKLAKNRGLDNPWLSFIPVASFFTMGAIADDINRLINKKSAYRIWLLVLGIIMSLSSYVLFFYYFRVFSDIGIYNDDPTSMMNAMMPFMGIAALINVIQLAFAIIRFIALYRIYADYNQSSAVAFLIFSILFGLAPFFLFAIRNKPSASIYYAHQAQQQYQNQFQQPQQQPYQPSYQQNSPIFEEPTKPPNEQTNN